MLLRILWHFMLFCLKCMFRRTEGCYIGLNKFYIIWIAQGGGQMYWAFWVNLSKRGVCLTWGVFVIAVAGQGLWVISHVSIVTIKLACKVTRGAINISSRELEGRVLMQLDNSVCHTTIMFVGDTGPPVAHMSLRWPCMNGFYGR